MNNIKSKIFIDGGNPVETVKAKELLGFLDGQTTNPTLIAKNLINKKTDNSQHITEEGALNEYKRIVQEMSKVIPDGSISIQVFANENTSKDEMIMQARERFTWIPNASIKLPCISEGFKAAETLCREMPINITLVFSQSQAGAVYEATLGAKYPVFLSPFVGRLDDIGQNGMQLIANILKMYEKGDGHVEVLTASVRNINHFLYALQLGSEIITSPFKVLQIWKEMGMKIPDKDFVYLPDSSFPIDYREDITLGKKWTDYDLNHPLTTKGVVSFWSDWNGLFSI